MGLRGSNGPLQGTIYLTYVIFLVMQAGGIYNLRTLEKDKALICTRWSNPYSQMHCKFEQLTNKEDEL